MIIYGTFAEEVYPVLMRWGFIVVTAAFCFAVSDRLFAAEGASGEDRGDAAVAVQPADVLVGVRQLQADLELLRSYMGRPASTLEFTVSAAAPREVYFQALTLFRKSNRLTFEHVQKRAAQPADPDGTIEPRHVLSVVNASRQRIQLVKQHYNIDARVEVPEKDPAKTPSDVFMAIVAANRQLNALLDQPFSPGDVYQQVMRANVYASRLIRLLPGSPAAPQPPDVEPGKIPADVYRRLLESFGTVQAIFRATELKTLDLKLSDELIDEVTPSDVYDIASLVASELSYLHQLRGDDQPPPRVFFPGRKFPSHVYQQAERLRRQLEVLREYVEEHPDWLEEGTSEK